MSGEGRAPVQQAPALPCAPGPPAIGLRQGGPSARGTVQKFLDVPPGRRFTGVPGTRVPCAPGEGTGTSGRIEPTDIEALVDLARDGDDAAFSSIYERFAPRVLRYLRHEVGDADVAEELMQRTFVRVIEGLATFERRQGIPFAAWVFRIARNAAIDERRRAHPAAIDVALQLPSGREGPDDLAIAALDRAELLAALERLPVDQHDVLVYRFFAELSPREVGRLMGRTDGAVRVLQYRALRALRGLLAEQARGRVTAEVGR